MDKFIIRKNKSNFFKSSKNLNNTNTIENAKNSNDNTSENAINSNDNTSENPLNTCEEKFICFTDGSTFNNGKK